MDPHWFTAHEWLGLVYLADSRPLEAISCFERALELSRCFNLQGGWLGYALAVSGRKSDALNALRTLDAIAQQHYVPEVARAAVQTGLGENEDVVESLERACRQSSGSVKVFSINIAPMWDPLRPEPRFQSLLRNMGFPESISK